jgi:hypothetical protein
MSYRILFVINALLAVLVGLAFLFVPSMALTQLGVEQYASTRLAAQFFGTAMLALGLLLWFSKDVQEANLQKGMGVAMLVGALAGLVITVIGISSASGVLRTNGWIVIIVYALFVLGYGFLVFLRPRMKE